MTPEHPYPTLDGRGGDFLAHMIAAARARVAQARAKRPLSRAARAAYPGRLRTALEHPRAGGLAVIAEIKRASPSKGAIAPALDAAARARAYERAGADAVSVLTEPTRFAGSLADLEAVAGSVTLPVLRKDFIVDPYQIWEAAAAGAAAVLLIAAALDGDELAALLGECAAIGLDALVEVHDEDDLLRAELAGARLVGVNNRDLRTLAVDLATTERLAPLASAGTLLVAESVVDEGVQVRPELREAVSVGGDVPVVEAVAGHAELREELERRGHLHPGAVHRVDCAGVPWSVEGTRAEHDTPVPGKGVPETDPDPEMVLHPLAQHEPVWLIHLEGEGIRRSEPAEWDMPINLWEERVGHDPALLRGGLGITPCQCHTWKSPPEA